MGAIRRYLVHPVTRSVMAIVGLIFIGTTIGRNAGSLREIIAAGWGDASLSLGLTALASLSASFAWWSIAQGRGKHQIGAYLASLVSRYVPGGFAQPLHQLSLAARTADEVGASGVRLLQHQLLSVGCAGILVAGGAVLLGSRSWLLIGLTASVGGLVAATPHVINWLWRVFRRDSVLHPASTKRLLITAVPTLIGIAALSASVVVLLPEEDWHLLEVGVGFVVAWIVGYVVVAAPGGIGVREGVLAALFAPHGTVLIAVSLIQRILGAVSDLGLAVVGAIVLRRARELHEPSKHAVARRGRS